MAPRFFTIFLAMLALISLVGVGFFACSDDDDDDDSDGDDDTDDDEVWRPAPGASWQLQFSGSIDESLDVDMYDIDLFDTDTNTIQNLHDDGRIVICYFSAGSYEEWREDADEFPDEAMGNDLEDWDGERWLDLRNAQVRDIMMDRMDLAVEKGCDGVDPDNVDGYANDNGLGLSSEDQLDYNLFIASEAHERGLSVGLKNDVAQLHDLVDSFDWALNEECFTYDECDTYSHFIDKGKAVFHVEYVDDWAEVQDLADEVCGAATELSTIIKEWELTANRFACDE